MTNNPEKTKDAPNNNPLHYHHKRNNNYSRIISHNIRLSSKHKWTSQDQYLLLQAQKLTTLITTTIGLPNKIKQTKRISSNLCNSNNSCFQKVAGSAHDVKITISVAVWNVIGAWRARVSRITMVCLDICSKKLAMQTMILRISSNSQWRPLVRTSAFLTKKTNQLT